MDLGDLLGELFEGIGGSSQLSSRGQRVVRFLFGGGLAVMCLFGAAYVLRDDVGLPFRLAGAAMFLTLAGFGLFGIAFGRGVKLFGCSFLVALVGVFAVRILFGA